MENKILTHIVATSILLSSCIQNDSYPLRCWVGVGNCTPITLEREFRVIDSRGKPVENFFVAGGTRSSFGLIPTPFNGDFIDMERKLNGATDFFVHVNKENVTVDHAKEGLACPIQIVPTTGNNRNIRIKYSTYFPKTLYIILMKCGSYKSSNIIIVRDMPIEGVITFMLED